MGSKKGNSKCNKIIKKTSTFSRFTIALNEEYTFFLVYCVKIVFQTKVGRLYFHVAPWILEFLFCTLSFLEENFLCLFWMWKTDIVQKFRVLIIHSKYKKEPVMQRYRPMIIDQKIPVQVYFWILFCSICSNYIFSRNN